MLTAVLIIIIAYLIGSIPSGLIIGKIGYGKDIRDFGSGNLGATNTFRVLGVVPGSLVLILDALKGILSIGIASYFFTQTPTLIQNPQNVDFMHSTVVVLSGFAAICGHNWSVYLKFSGGKGVATGAGVLIMLVPKIILILLVIWLVLVLVFRYVSLASVSMTLLFPVLMIYYYPGNIPYILFSLIAAFAVTFQHRSNIRRLIEGKENRVGEKGNKDRSD